MVVISATIIFLLGMSALLPHIKLEKCLLSSGGGGDDNAMNVMT